MIDFAAKTTELRTGFSVLNISEKEEALNMLEELVEAFSQTILWEKVQIEANLTIADHAGRIILERFADDFMAMESNSSGSLWRSNDGNLNDFGELSWGINFSSQSSHQQEVNLNVDRSVLPGDDFMDQTGDEDIQAAPIKLDFEQSLIAQLDRRKPLVDNVKQQASSSEIPGSSTEYICATCNFVANNRKMLYRHGLKESHVTRQAIEKTGQFKCVLCDFITNKKYNYDRHLQRTHFAVRNHACEYCEAKFKDNDTLKNHLKTVHAALIINK